MSGMSQAFRAHIETGITTLCRAWAITRTDGQFFGFTDHDQALAFDGMEFKADSGLSAMALSQSTGLSVDNTEAIGALSDASVREDDIESGRFDGADVQAWLVNWAQPDERWLQFRGTIGSIQRAGGAFNAELRGLSEALNKPQGRVFQKPCSAVLGDGSCKFDLSAAGYSTEIAVQSADDGRAFLWEDIPGFAEGWFQRGRLDVLDGPGKGLWGIIKRDRTTAEGREIELWAPLRSVIEADNTVRLSAGCDKRFETCRLKFDNLMNFQGFPDIPGDDWLVAVPKKAGINGGGSRR
ncbi:MAG: DUF2163 domain-containing protein [Paracoccaceae bacterium]